MDWLGKFLNLPEVFLNCSEGPGGGVIQGNARNQLNVHASLKILNRMLQALQVKLFWWPPLLPVSKLCSV